MKDGANGFSEKLRFNYNFTYKVEKSVTEKAFSKLTNLKTIICEAQAKREQRSRGDPWSADVQAKKSIGRMPWHQEPKKDAMNCEKPRGVVNKRYIRGYPNGETHVAKSHVPYGESNSHTGGTRRTETSK